MTLEKIDLETMADDLNYRLTDLPAPMFNIKPIEGEMKFELWFLFHRLYFSLNHKIDIHKTKRSDLMALLMKDKAIKSAYENKILQPFDNSWDWICLGLFPHMQIVAFLSKIVPEIFEQEEENAT